MFVARVWLDRFKIGRSSGHMRRSAGIHVPIWSITCRYITVISKGFRKIGGRISGDTLKATRTNVRAMLISAENLTMRWTVSLIAVVVVVGRATTTIMIVIVAVAMGRRLLTLLDNKGSSRLL